MYVSVFFRKETTMPILLSNLRAGLSEPEAHILSRARKKLPLPDSAVRSARICKRSLDARHRDRPPCFVYSVKVELRQEEREEELVRKLADPFIAYKPQIPLVFLRGKQKLQHPVSVVGFGPAGIFAAYVLAKNGYPVVVYERGAPLEERTKAVGRFWKEGTLDEKANVQFGEGGAGTFSDGKLTTRISDSLCDYVLATLADHGAPPEILTMAKPHIGTDRLRLVIRAMREDIRALGGQVLFHRRLESVCYRKGQLTLCVDGERIETSAAILALGHSARDTFASLFEAGLEMEPKSFSAGVRIEQLQETIDRGLYGKWAGDPLLPKGEYQLSHRKGTRCVYTFCMCPGGFVVPAASEAGGVVVNGMSEHARDGQNANSALVVSVDPAGFGTHPLDGVAFQRRLEQAAFQMGGGGYAAPAMTVGDFLEPHSASGWKSVQPTYACGVREANLPALFPPDITELLREGLRRFDQKLPGFSAREGVLTGVETRTSSPLRILRQEEGLQATGFPGLYPCGEGAGYAGGIMSAAVDGIRVAREIMAQYSPD